MSVCVRACETNRQADWLRCACLSILCVPHLFLALALRWQNKGILAHAVDVPIVHVCFVEPFALLVLANGDAVPFTWHAKQQRWSPPGAGTRLARAHCAINACTALADTIMWCEDDPGQNTARLALRSITADSDKCVHGVWVGRKIQAHCVSEWVRVSC